jgi:hypothetical protein
MSFSIKDQEKNNPIERKKKERKNISHLYPMTSCGLKFSVVQASTVCATWK